MKRFTKLAFIIVTTYVIVVGSILLFAMTREGVSPSIPDWSEASIPVEENTGEQGATINPQRTIDMKELERLDQESLESLRVMQKATEL